MPKLTMLSGPSGSGKSTIAKKMMEDDPNLVRVNRDSIRAMSIVKWTPKKEGWIIDAEIAMVRAAALSKRNVLIDDTNLMPKDELLWSRVAKEMKYLFEKKEIKVDLLTCIQRDSQRIGTARIGRPAIERQFLRGKLWTVPSWQYVWIFDIDGTLADLQHRVAWITIGANCPNCQSWPRVQSGFPCVVCRDTKKVVKKQHGIFYSLVAQDEPIEIVIKWIQTVYNEINDFGKRSNLVLIVSGRSPETSGDGTVDWLEQHQVPYDHLIMRRAYHHGPDDEEKQLILNDILEVVPKKNIAFVVDDRPNVVRMWKKNGLRVIPVRGRDDDKFYELETNESQSG